MNEQGKDEILDFTAQAHVSAQALADAFNEFAAGECDLSDVIDAHATYCEAAHNLMYLVVKAGAPRLDVSAV